MITQLILNEGEPSPFALGDELAAYTRTLWLTAKPTLTEIEYADGVITCYWSQMPTDADLEDIQALREGRYNVGANIGA